MKAFKNLGMILALLLLVCFTQKSYASHWQGADLTYSCVAPGTYVVNLKLYRDCSGTTASTSASLNLKSPGCNNGRNVTMNKVGATRIGDPYCANIPKTCTSTGRTNYEEVTFTATVTFSAAEQTCNNWILSWQECCRPNIANITGASSDNLYAEAMVNLGAGINNNSPEFSPLNVPIPFVCVGRPTIYSLNAAEADGDSLVYSLDTPLNAYNDPVTYAPYSGNTAPPIPGFPNLIINPTPKLPYENPFSPQYAQLTSPPPANYSPTFPMPSVNVNWSGAATIPMPGAPIKPFIWSATNQFLLDPASGELRFTPSKHVAGATSASGQNKYAVVVKITEYRRVNGVMTVVGYIRRDILFIVEDCGNNLPPADQPKPIPPKFKAIVDDTLFQVQTCNTTRVVLQYIDTVDNITIDIDKLKFESTVPGGKLDVYNNNSDTVSVVMYITPQATDAGKKYFVPVKIEDDACPIKNVITRVYTINVVKNNLATFLDTVKTVCLGNSTNLDVTLIRPDSVLNAPVTYQYQWNPAPGLNPADANKASITVTPTQTTRYFVTVTNPVLGGCSDTASVLVKVVPLPIITDIVVGPGPGNNYVIPFGQRAKLTPKIGNANTANYKYSWSPSANLENEAGDPDSTSAEVWARPLKTTTYTLSVQDENGDCVSTKTVEVKVAPFTLPNVITPNNDKLNDVFEFKGILPNTSLKIYNRWGALVKEYGSYDNSFNGDGVADGTYYYIVQEPNGGKSYKGWFEIIRK